MELVSKTRVFVKYLLAKIHKENRSIKIEIE